MKLMTMLMAALAILICTAFTACKDTAPLTPAQTIATSCASVSAAVRVLTEANKAGKLSVEAQARVSDALTVTDAVCRSPTPPTLQEAELAAFNAALTTLQANAEAANER